MFGKKKQKGYKNVSPKEPVTIEDEFTDEDMIPQLEGTPGRALERPPEKAVYREPIAKREVKQKIKTIVVSELPTQPIRRVRMADGSIANLITTTECLTRIMEELEEE